MNYVVFFLLPSRIKNMIRAMIGIKNAITIKSSFAFLSSDERLTFTTVKTIITIATVM